MDNNIKLENGNLSALCSFILGIVTWLTPENVEYLLKFLVAIGSIITAIMAVRYYFYAIKEKKQQIRDHDQKPHNGQDQSK